jgi:hypothetical protein
MLLGFPGAPATLPKANGGFFVSRRFPDRGLAVEEAGRWRRKYEAEGWPISLQA